MIRVVCIEDHFLILENITQKLANLDDIQLVGTARSAHTVFDLVEEKSPDVMILEPHTGGGDFDPIMTVQRLRENYPALRILVITRLRSPIYLRALVTEGVTGCLLKTDREPINLPEVIRSVHVGKHHYSSSIRDVLLSEEGVPPYFSNQEIQVLQRVANGLLPKTIADQMALPIKDIGPIMKSVYQKMGIDLKPSIVPEIVMMNKARKMDLLLTEPF